MSPSVQTENACPHCGHRLDTVTAVDGISAPPVPQPGDLTICLYCATPLIFTEAGSLRHLTLVDWQEIDLEDRQALLRAYRIALEYRRLHARSS